ncbi:response regulator transcription factor [Mucilaginibacter sp. JRF]|uniref:LytR/AlgR family response regulator transcription factor n=1 Tax=Mucilaginibacter sp. JRF TaxID=2780088 RepID=UPI00187E3EF0|nr:LytTR family DNA-binding domain-containing protein [Mucilaginibacter sp. JRF]MBE9583274.1 response regulator transcription factor [Mucilaginibacter sp. JRF]
MRILLIEDEVLAAKRLASLISNYDPEIVVLDIIDSVEDAVIWLNTNPSPDLIFMDIMLADGQSFEIFEQTEVKAPVIFTTAFDEFAIKAFKVNSIDYLLKPVEPQLLDMAMRKFDRLQPRPENFREIVESLLIGVASNKYPAPTYKKRFLVKQGDKYIPIAITDVAYFSFEDKLSFLYTRGKKRYMLDHTLDELDKMLDPAAFFRLNRQYITSFPAVKTIHNYFNGKLKVYVTPDLPDGIVVSKSRAALFKQWLSR